MIFYKMRLNKDKMIVTISKAIFTSCEAGDHATMRNYIGTEFPEDFIFLGVMGFFPIN